MGKLSNVGSWDRFIRIGVGVAVTSLAFWGPENLMFLVGLVPIITGLVGWCPLYTLFGFKTCTACGADSSQKAA